MENANAVGAEPASSQPYTPVPVSVKSLLEAGAHFGHQAQRWNPRMLPFIYCERNGIHIINLDLTIQAWQRARRFLVDTAARGGTILFVGTKQQGREIIEQHAKRCSAFYVVTRWLGGTLSNFQTIKNSIDRMRKLEEFLQKADQEGGDVKINKKEKLTISRQVVKLSTNLGGIRHMRKPPDVIFIVDINKEAIAVNEARKLRIPVVALVDTNTDPELVDYPIPCNDDASRAIELMVAAAADAVLEGRAIFDARVASQQSGDDGKREVVKGGDDASLVKDGVSGGHAGHTANGM
jgi:small subunit ribosomal protein S2